MSIEWSGYCYKCNDDAPVLLLARLEGIHSLVWLCVECIQKIDYPDNWEVRSKRNVHTAAAHDMVGAAEQDDGN